ncbi:MAG: SUMF1/EgtB/PvdO family nonheme iron enzyme [Nitrospirae bacterium]|nr:SUMF1/EgtB/PvdO family nonheme iron enzyme [Nitrospirota bacterium]MBF0534970.1 SUMF1/EgtB/PvdO family nonheme iron enzyme [Nitrospirota bacterium]MBF0617178.1 SUMF1/EgtB/PvdO family nonheme iron enzyme [Nitrospirota bacterium]
MKRIVTILMFAAFTLTAVMVLKEDVYGETYTDRVTSMEFVKIGAGLYIGKYEVTNAQYRKFKPNHNSKALHEISLNGDKQPVVYVSFDDAEEFAKWLSHKTGMKYRLPTEKEWETACKAGADIDTYWEKSEDACRYANLMDETHRAKVFPYLPQESLIMVNCEDGFVLTAPVGSKEPNKFGLYDMLGNVSEWTDTPHVDKRITRGGSWTSIPERATCSYSKPILPKTWAADIGFRLVLEKK